MACSTQTEWKVFDKTRRHAFPPLECSALGRLTDEWQDAIDICRGQEFNIHVLMDLMYEGLVEKQMFWEYETHDGKTTFTRIGYRFRLKPELQSQ